MIYLYIKQCPHCGLKYFGKTIKKDMSYETRMKMSLASKGIPKSEEHRRKMSEAQKLRWSGQRINIHELQTGAA